MFGTVIFAILPIRICDLKVWIILSKRSYNIVIFRISPAVAWLFCFPLPAHFLNSPRRITPRCSHPFIASNLDCIKPTVFSFSKQFRSSRRFTVIISTSTFRPPRVPSYSECCINITC